jgi:hypothetical protein
MVGKKYIRRITDIRMKGLCIRLIDIVTRINEGLAGEVIVGGIERILAVSIE